MLSTRDHILSYLLESEGYVSGEDLSNRLDISRAAVNTAVKSLRNDGYKISSSTKKGYLLENRPDKLGYGELLHFLGQERMKDVIFLDSVDSTNNYLKDIASSPKIPTGTVVVSDHQTRGKGRLGRSFESPKGKGVYLSYLIRPGRNASDISSITAKTSVCIINAISKVCGITPSVKWVNDIILNGKKISGTLTELSSESESGLISSIVIGTGININERETDFPEEIRQKASSLFLETGKKTYRAALAAEFIKELDNMTSLLGSGEDLFLASYREHCITTGHDVGVVSVHDSGETPRIGRALEVNPDYTLKVRFTDGSEEDIRSGEVSVRGLLGYT